MLCSALRPWGDRVERVLRLIEVDILRERDRENLAEPP
jgi:hypothetical protein